uniref:DUF1640 domain-containing protein n=2 Tax=unclassified Candidatus Kentrum TaxID=2643149 RepID=A0A451ANL8_9GAMM|nr:MAG: hypothetical protein BECKLPF1236B_GA0070989_12862 [Candidatus Kentron sp. LPFa]VFK67634.1 MAG: hypothetical protein BECKUNK1418G_GA0071005_11533 [Candidatus Kentron sp. UNK]VFK72863.1 MAG: hypothetical protein BECKUNK1418H_GA0071006_11453 [Candidatus Kentron sp. UNK]
MFDNDIFEKWLDSQSQAIVDKMGQGAQLRTEEMMILVLKAQSNHFHHLDKDLRNEMITLRGDMRDEMITLRGDMRDEMITLRTDMRDEMKTLREDMDRRFESVDKRFEQVIRRMDRFMFWSLGVTVAAAAFVVTYLK